MRRVSERDARGAGWARAKYVLRELISREVGAIRDVGWITKIGDGLSREIFAAEIEFIGGRCESYVVALPRADAPPELNDSTTRELRLLARLRAYPFPFHVPETVGAFPDGKHLALVRKFTPGVELDFRAGRQRSVTPWEIVGEIAAAIHQAPVAAAGDVLAGPLTR